MEGASEVKADRILVPKRELESPIGSMVLPAKR
jgi:hypothetical protein